MQNLPSFFYDDSESDRDLEVFITQWVGWTVRCATEPYNLPLRDYPKKILLKLLGIAPDSEVKILEVKTWREWERIDLCIEVALEMQGVPQTWALAAECKMYNKFAEGQLEKYKNTFEKHYQEKNPHTQRRYVYLVGREELYSSEIHECEKCGFQALTVTELKDVFGENPLPTGNTLFDEFWFLHNHANPTQYFYSTGILKITDESQIVLAVTKLKQLKELTRAEIGNIAFEVGQSKDDVSIFVIWECFTDEDAYNKHIASSYVQDFLNLEFVELREGYQTRDIR